MYIITTEKKFLRFKEMLLFMKVYYSNNGCSIEGEDFFRFLRLSKNEKTDNIFSADIIISRFCGMSTESFEDIPQTMAFFKGMKTKNPKLKLFIGGCASEVVDLKKRYPFVDGVFRRRLMVEDLSSYFHYDPSADKNCPISFYNSVRIQSGCLRNCGFCKKGYMNMPLRSKPIDRVLQDIGYAVANNYRYINLLAENSTEYGLDLPEKVTLIDLLRHIENMPEITGLTIAGLCIDELVSNNELVEFIKNSTKCFNLQLEIQSLIPRVRRNMRLSSTVEEVLSILKELSNKHIITNIMLGYPGENEENFREELKLIEKMDLYYVQVNVYDDSPCVYGHSFEQIPKETVIKREFMLLKVLNSLRQKKAKDLITQSKHEPLPCIYTQEGTAMLLNDSGIVQLKNNDDNYYYGQIIKVKLTNIQHSFDIFDSNQSLVLEGVIV